MLVCGIDVGAKNVSTVILQDNDILSYCVLTSGEEGATVSRKAVDKSLSKTGFNFDDIQTYKPIKLAFHNESRN